MRIFIFFLVFILFYPIQAQITFVDVEFENALLSAAPTNTVAKVNGVGVAVDTNLNGTIEQAEAALIEELDLNQYSNFAAITDVTELSYFTALHSFYASGTGIQYLDFSQCQGILNLDISNTPMVSITFKNGITNPFFDIFNCINTPNLAYLCVDAAEEYIIWEFFASCNNAAISTNSFCSSAPGGNFSTIKGGHKVDLNLNGCDPNDQTVIPYFELDVMDSMGNNTTLFSVSNGTYTFNSGNLGNHTITPISPNPTYWSIAPNPASVNVAAFNNQYIQDFCITPIGTFNDIFIYLYPTSAFNPNLPSTYKIGLRNIGNTIMSGSVDFSYNANYMTFVSASPAQSSVAGGVISWNFSNLLPFQTEFYELTLQLNLPTDPNFPVNIGDVFCFDATANPIAGDVSPSNNVFTNCRTVTNSYDPNDKTCLEGETVGVDKIGEFVHYMIRFENIGTANAINVNIIDELDDSKFDVSTFKPIGGSHNFTTEVKDNVVHFSFDNIQLPFNQPDSQGYVLYKIKTLSSLNEGDTFSNQADIYFDYNPPIVTNNYTTEIISLEVEDLNRVNNKSVIVSPNPVGNVLQLVTDETLKKFEIYDLSGKLMKVSIGNQKLQEVSQLPKGVYVIKVHTSDSIIEEKFIKK